MSTYEEALELTRAASALVGFPCKKNCTTCCKTRITMLQVEWDGRIKGYVEEVLGSTDKAIITIYSDSEREANLMRLCDERGWCPFLDEGVGCLIHDQVRPFVCYQYGQHWSLFCCEGVECPPGMGIQDDVVERFAVLMSCRIKDASSPEARQELKRKVIAWRKEHGMPGDVVPHTLEHMRQLQDL